MAKILVVDDDASFAVMLADFLAAMGHHVARAADQAQARDLARTQKPDVILLDMEIPGGGGPKTLSALEAESALGDAGVVLCSGLAIEKMQQTLPPAPRRRYVTKPVDLLALKGLIDELLAGARR
ncbi:MAG: response regulator [Elusimicrobia bacterium]|nr:response regulator [Elusimicrobiota bacterium]